jgi:hypothetical protein
MVKADNAVLPQISYPLAVPLKTKP